MRSGSALDWVEFTWSDGTKYKPPTDVAEYSNHKIHNVPGGPFTIAQRLNVDDEPLRWTLTGSNLDLTCNSPMHSNDCTDLDLTKSYNACEYTGPTLRIDGKTWKLGAVKKTTGFSAWSSSENDCSTATTDCASALPSGFTKVMWTFADDTS